MEDGEDFTEFRVRVCELIKDCVFIVGSSTVFRYSTRYWCTVQYMSYM